MVFYSNVSFIIIFSLTSGQLSLNNFDIIKVSKFVKMNTLFHNVNNY